MNEEFSLVDCCVAPILWRLKEVGITLPEKSTRPLFKYMHMILSEMHFARASPKLKWRCRSEAAPPLPAKGAL